MSETLYTVNKEDFFERKAYLNEDGTPKDLTGYTSLIRITKYYGSTNIIVIGGVVEIPTTNGFVKYEAPHTVWNNVTPGAYVYSRYLYDSTNKVVDIVSGDLILIPAV